MIIAGFWSGHDCSFCSLEDGIPVFHAELERYIREKEPQGDSIAFMMEHGLSLFERADFFATCTPASKAERYTKTWNQLFSGGWTKNKEGFWEKRDAPRLVDRRPVYFFGHHRAHAANAFYSSPYEHALVVTLDGGGVEENGLQTACTAWYGNGIELIPLIRKQLSEFNIGGLWTRCTRYIFKLQSGWPYGHQAGSVMAMAALGKPRYLQQFEHMLGPDLERASRKPPTQPKGPYIPGKDPQHPYLEPWARLAQSEEARYDIAASLQLATEKAINTFFDEAFVKLKSVCGVDHPVPVALAGGVVLNSVAVGKLLDDHRIKDIYVTPTPHDGGLPIGAAQYLYHAYFKNPRVEGNSSPYLGREYADLEVRQAIARDDLVIDESDDGKVIDLLASGKIVAVFGGGSESGRRALGNRSILADPRRAEMKDFVNQRVKHRQHYRPFAPSILRECVTDWFVRDVDSPYMSFVVHVKPERRDEIPAVVHFDGTARLQTVREIDNHWYYHFLKKWEEKTGVPILLNTSYNDKTPIVETPRDAVECFLGTEIDFVYFRAQKLLVSRRDDGKSLVGA